MLARPPTAGEVEVRDELPVDGRAGGAGRGRFCAVAAMTPRGPHCTPLVFAFSGGRLWLTTSRRSVKARAWRTDPVDGGPRATRRPRGHVHRAVHTYDAAGSPDMGRRRRRRAVDRARPARSARRTPGSSPATRSTRGRSRSRGPRPAVSSSASTRAHRAARGGGVAGGQGTMGRGRRVRTPTFRARQAGCDPLAPLPVDDRRARSAARARARSRWSGERGRWCCRCGGAPTSAALYAALPEESLSLADAGPDAPVALTRRSPVGVARPRHGRRDGAGHGRRSSC